MKKKEFILIGSILGIAAVLWLGIMIWRKDSGETIRISVDGETYGEWSLSKNQVIEIGDTNVCEIKDGKVTMIKASCPDHLCMKQAPVGKDGGMIVCLPNKVIIEGTGVPGGSGNPNAPAVDAVG